MTDIRSSKWLYLKATLLLEQRCFRPLLLVREFRRESDVETSYSNVIATLKGKLADVPENEAVFLTLRIKNANDVAIILRAPYLEVV